MQNNMKHWKIIVGIILGVVAIGGGFLFFQEAGQGAPQSSSTRGLIPFTTAKYYIGTSSPSTLEYKGIFTQDLTVSGTCTGCGGAAAGGGLWSDAVGFIYSGLTNASTTNETVLIGNTATNTTNKLEVWGNISADIFIATSTTATSTFAGGLTVDTNKFLVDPDAGRVGIGTVAPVTKLSIKGNDDKDTGPIITLNGNAINQFESGRIRFAETDMFYQGGFIHFDGSVNTFNIGVHDNADNLTSSDINAISILRSNGNIGIGTTSPNAPLEVVGTPPGSVGGFQSGMFQVTNPSTAEFGNAVITGHNYFSDNTQLWYLGSVSGSDNDIGFINRQNATMQFWTNNIERVVIDANGLVGIGTTSPYAKLSVVGQTVAEYFTATSTTATSTFTGIQWDYSTSTGQDLTLSRIGESTFSTVQDLQNIFHSAGWTSGGTIADIGGAAISVAAGTGLIRTSNSATALVPYFDWVASTTIDIPADTIRYIGVEYNSGSPRVAIRTTYNWNLKTDFPLGNVVNEGGTIHLENTPQAVGDHAATMIERAFESLGKQRDNITGGLIIGETGSRNVTMSSGTLWERLSSFAISAIDTSGADTFDTYCGTTKNETATSTWDNLNYCNSGSLTALSNNRWAVLWFYIELDGDLIMQYGTAQYVSEASAEIEGTPSTVTNRVIAQSKLIGRFIFQESASTAESIETVFATTFAGAVVTDHGNLAGLSDDDHTQYVLADGTRALTANWDAGSFDITATRFVADDATATTSLQATSVTGAISILGEYFTNFTTYVRSLFTAGTGINISSGSISATLGTSIDAGEITAGAIDGDDINSNIAGSHLTLTSASPDTFDLDSNIPESTIGFALLATTTADGIATTSPFFKTLFTSSAYTISSFRCHAGGTGTSTVQVTHSTDPFSAGTDLLYSTGFECGSDISTATTTFSDTTVPANSYWHFSIDDAEPTGTRPDSINPVFTATKDD